MKRDSRLSNILHALLHMAEHETRTGAPMTSDQLAVCLSTNPVVVRRTMAGLRDHGYVRSEKGHGGGWSLATPLADISLLDIHEALGSPAPFAFGLANDDPDCLVEKAVNARLSDAMADAEAILRARLAAVTLADIATDFQKRLTAGGRRRGAR